MTCHDTERTCDMDMTFMALNAQLPLVREDSYAYAIGNGDLWILHTPSTGELGALLMGTEQQARAEMSKVGVVTEYPSKRRPGRPWKMKLSEQ